ncbi:T9SS type A sorting domain-containing protein [Rufibacter roseus]|uniref:T9SS type A sorting domain-containing protein n=1 Tax=Rufibacter roseus TaxID=1567108 RepID=UPI00366F3DD6
MLISKEGFAQTPGMIIEKATGPGAAILDKDNNGYVSKTRAGFAPGLDVGPAYSEIPYKVLPQYASQEPLVDLGTGSGGGQTDLASNPLSMWFDGIYVYFRVRVGGYSSASKGYSFVLDTDGIFNARKDANGNVITYTTPSKVKNLGFEYEVVFASNFDVLVYKHTGSGDDNDPALYSNSVIWKSSNNGGISQYSQKSMAGSMDGGNADYFYDFYVPLSAFGGGITADTNLRVSGSSVTSAQTGLEGTISDIGGLNDKNYGNDKMLIWKDVVPAFPPTSLNDIMNGGFNCAIPPSPTITNTLKALSTTISGYSNQPNGTIINLYKGGTIAADGSLTNGTAIGTTGTVTVVNNTWTATLITPLAVDEVIRATATSATGSCVSKYSSPVKVISGICSTPIPAQPASSNGNKGITGSYTVPAGYTGPVTIQAYKILSTTPYYSSDVNVIFDKAGTANSFVTYEVTSTSSTFTYTIVAGTGQAISPGSFVVTARLGTGCESPYSLPVCIGNQLTSTPIPSITSAPSNLSTTANSASISVSVANNTNPTFSSMTLTLEKRFGVAGAYGYVRIKEVVLNPTPTPTSYTHTFTLTATEISTLAPGDVLLVRALGSGTNVCISESAANTNINIVAPPSTAPLISGTYCTITNNSITSVAGTSTEVAGTTIHVYKSGTTAAIATTTVATGGAWTATVASGVLTPSSSFFATATAPNKSVSPNSTLVTVTTKTTAAGTTVNSIMEGANSISGTKSSGSTLILYADGSPVIDPVTNLPIAFNYPTATTWSISSTVLPTVLAAGSVVTVRVSGGNECSGESAPVTVQCSPPSGAFSFPNTPTHTVCSGTAITLSLDGSQAGVIYQIYNNNVASGYSVLGTGSPISLTSFGLTAAATLTVRATKPSGVSCGIVTMGGSASYNVNTACSDQPAVYSAPSVRINNTSESGNIINPAVDPNGAISYSSITGSPLPSFIALDQTSLVKRAGQPLQVGTYTTLVTTVDALGGTTMDLPLVIEVFQDTPRENGVISYPSGYQLKLNENLAEPTDADLGIFSAQISNWDSPSGLSYNTSTGRIFVSDPDAITTRNYTYNMRTVDNTGGITEKEISFSTTAPTPLPVELTYFSANYQKGIVQMQWITSSEKDNDYFLVQRSTNGKSFETIGQVKGNGFSTVILNYSFLDMNAPIGQLYYRLKQVDFDGNSEFSKVVTTRAFEANAPKPTVTVAPNPFNQDITVKINCASQVAATLELVSLQHKKVYSEQINLSPGTNHYTRSWNDIPAGLYLLQINGADLHLVVKIIKTD